MEDLKLEDEAPASSADGLKGSLLSVLASRSLGNLGKIAPRIASSAGPRRASRPRDSGTIAPFQDTIPLASSGASGSAGNVERGPEDGSSGSSRIHVVVAKKTTLLTEATAALAAEERLVSGELQVTVVVVVANLSNFNITRPKLNYRPKFKIAPIRDFHDVLIRFIVG